MRTPNQNRPSAEISGEISDQRIGVKSPSSLKANEKKEKRKDTGHGNIMRKKKNRVLSILTIHSSVDYGTRGMAPPLMLDPAG